MMEEIIKGILESEVMQDIYDEEQILFAVVLMPSGDYFASVNDFNGSGRTLEKAMIALSKDIKNYIDKETEFENDILDFFEKEGK
ncbi:MAG: hypothetical protein ACRC6E_10360 [Fusobacteriaceae bacterium]